MRRVLLLVLGLILLEGCSSLQSPPVVDLPTLPTKKQIRVGHYLFVADFDLPRGHPLLKELESLEEQVTRELQLSPGNNLVQIYLFKDRQRYEEYMHSHFKNLPTRRAFFMARTDERRGEELLVYTYWGDRIQEDLRHELTHAILHGSMKQVPMWLDEGLAEYFEVGGQQGLNYRHLSALRSQPGIPWTPNLARLERLTLVKDMSPADYRESWAWVHFMLQGSPAARSVLLHYIQQLRQDKDPGLLEPYLTAAVADPEAALRRHLLEIENATRSLGHIADGRQRSEPEPRAEP